MAEGGIAKAPRYLVSEGAVIKFSQRTIDCSVRNLSETGAAIEVPNQPGIPAQFELTIMRLGSCLVAWYGAKITGSAWPSFRLRLATAQPCSLHAA
jgi:PilZ domain